MLSKTAVHAKLGGPCKANEKSPQKFMPDQNRTSINYFEGNS